MIRRYFQEPPIVQTPLDDVWMVVVPAARTNLITNPSFETNTTSWTAIGGSIARSTTQQYHGAYSLSITPTSATTDGARYDTVSLTSGTLYAYSAKVLGQKGVGYKLCVETTGGSELVSTPFVASGRWQWVYGYYAETSSTTRRITLRKNSSASTAVFYLDGVQVEALADASEAASTYIDGDQLGLVPNQSPPAYYWTGTPHASTSTRSGLTRAGGEVKRFSDFGFTLMAIVGLGLAAPQNVATEYARLDGGYDDYTRKPTRQFSLVGRFDGRSYAELRDNRGGLSQLLDRDLIGLDQRMTLLHRIEGPCGDVQSNDSRILCKYQSGLGGNTEGQHAEQTPLTFVQYMPTVLADGESGSALSVTTSITNANNILYRSPGGAWSAMGTGASGATGGVGGAVQDTNGNVYVTGDFTSMGGVANTASIAKWNGSAWSAMGTGATGGGAGPMALDAQQRLYVGGAFTSMGGVANTDSIARWTGSAWQSVATPGADNNVQALVVAPNGTVYAGGLFGTINGVAAARIAQYDGTNWTALGTGAAGGNVYALATDAAGNLYAAGDFTSMGGVANTARIAKWNGSTWSALGTGMSSLEVLSLAVDARGFVYAGGTFTSAGGVSVNYVAQWNGVQWQPLGAGVTAVGSPQVTALSVAPEGIYASGIFDQAGNAEGIDSLALWNGTTWLPVNIDLPGGAGPLTGVVRRVYDGGLYVGFNQTGTATAPATTTVTNAGTARSYPTIRITGPTSGSSRLFQIVNQTTGRAIYLNNYVMLQGETAILSFQPDNLSFVSDFQGNIASFIMPGSDAANFFLQPGTNVITFFAASNTVTATISYRPAYVSLDDVP